MITSNNIFGPLRVKKYRSLWLADAVSNFGSWMHTFAAGWVIANLSSTATEVASMQAATMIPAAVIMIPASFFSDRVAPPKYLLICQIYLTAVAVCIACLHAADMLSVTMLILFTALLSLGAGATAPVWQSVTVDIVDPRDIPSAAALNGISFNLARSFGPALGAVFLVKFGPSLIFVVNAISFLGLAAVFVAWLRNDDFVEKYHPGYSFDRFSFVSFKMMTDSISFRRKVMATSVSFFITSMAWALLPKAVKLHVLSEGERMLGLAMSFAGFGGFLAAAAMPRLRSIIGVEKLLGLYLALTAVGTLLFVMRSPGGFAFAGCSLSLGFGWGGLVASSNLLAQTAFEKPLRTKAIAFNTLCTAAATGVGSLFWGMFSDLTSISAAGTISAVVSATIAIFFAKSSSFDGDQAGATQLAPDIDSKVN